MYGTCNRTPLAVRRRRPSAGLRTSGFTLVEVMVALGILAAALPMVATALLSGMLENEESVQTTMGSMLADNAIGILRCRARDSDRTSFPAGWGVGATALTLANHRVRTTVIAEADCDYWPFEDPAHPKGRRTFAFVILGQRMHRDTNDFRFVVMVYRKIQPNDALASAKVTFTTSGQSAGMVDDNPSNTFVKLTSAPGQSALLSTHVVRLSLRP